MHSALRRHSQLILLLDFLFKYTTKATEAFPLFLFLRARLAQINRQNANGKIIIIYFFVRIREVEWNGIVE